MTPSIEPLISGKQKMNRLNTRKWSTPIIIGSGIFVSISGVLMFLGIHNPVETAHEWIGLLFAAGIVLHVLTHWRSFKNYFSQRLALNLVGATLVATSVFIFTSATQDGGNMQMSMINSFENSPLTEVAPLLDETPGQIVTRFEVAGFRVENPQMTISEIASSNAAEPRKLVQTLFN